MSRHLIWRARVVILVMIVGLLLGACDSVSFVDRLLLVNDTAYSANVDVRGESGGWVELASVSAKTTVEVREVIDRGPAWTFRFSYGDHAPVDIELSRGELQDANWRVEVPDEFEANLRAEGVEPPP